MASTPTEHVTVRCACGAKLKVPASALGKAGKCPKCHQRIELRAANEPATPRGKPAAEAPLDSLMAEMEAQQAAGEELGLAPAPPMRSSACPNCGAAMGAGAVLCIACGCDTRTGKRVKAVKTKTGPSGAERLAKAAGSFVLGCVVSFVGAAVGAGVWCAVAMGTGYKVGFVAMGVGALAGLGMAVGYRNQNPLAGLVASGMALLGIVLGNVLIMFSVAYVAVTGSTSNIELQRGLLAAQMTNDDLDERGVTDPGKRFSEWDAIYREKEKEADRWSADEVRKRWSDYQAEVTEDSSDPVVQKRYRLAVHFGEQRARADGLAYTDDQWEKFREEELKKFRRMAAADVEAEIKRLDEWETTGKWSDEAAVRSELIYRGVHAAAVETGRPTAEPPDELYDMSKEDFRSLYDKTAANVDKLSKQERTTTLKKMIKDEEANAQRDRLVWHRTMRAAQKKGLAPWDEQREVIEAGEREATAKLTAPEVKAAADKLEQWEKEGKWSDSDYLRDHLVGLTMREISYDRRDSQAEPESGDEPQSQEARLAQWTEDYKTAVGKVDVIPVAERAARARQLETELDQRMQQRMAEWSEEADAEADGEDGGGVVAFVKNMFGFFDVLWIILAIGTAFRIASGSLSESGSRF